MIERPLRFISIRIKREQDKQSNTGSGRVGKKDHRPQEEREALCQWLAHAYDYVQWWEHVDVSSA